MAGSIFITADSSWSASTVAFSVITEMTKEQLQGIESVPIDSAFAPLAQSSDFISLEELQPRDFLTFYQLCKKGYEKFIADSSRERTLGDLYEGVRSVWLELLDLMKSDSRLI